MCGDTLVSFYFFLIFFFSRIVYHISETFFSVLCWRMGYEIWESLHENLRKDYESFADYFFKEYNNWSATDTTILKNNFTNFTTCLNFETSILRLACINMKCWKNQVSEAKAIHINDLSVKLFYHRYLYLIWKCFRSLNYASKSLKRYSKLANQRVRLLGVFVRFWALGSFSVSHVPKEIFISILSMVIKKLCSTFINIYFTKK